MGGEGNGMEAEAGELADHILIHTQEARRENRKWDEAKALRACPQRSTSSSKAAPL